MTANILKITYKIDYYSNPTCIARFNTDNQINDVIKSFKFIIVLFRCN